MIVPRQGITHYTRDIWRNAVIFARIDVDLAALHQPAFLPARLAGRAALLRNSSMASRAHAYPDMRTSATAKWRGTCRAAAPLVLVTEIDAPFRQVVNR